MDTGLTYSALKDRQVDTAVVFATDGRIPAFNFVVLKDDKHYAPWYNLTPVVRKEILDSFQMRAFEAVPYAYFGQYSPAYAARYRSRPRWRCRWRCWT